MMDGPCDNEIKIRSERSLRCIISFVRIAVILHNALVNAPYDESWIDEDFLELDAAIPCEPRYFNNTNN